MNILEQLASGLLNYSRSEPEGLLARGMRQPAGLLGRGLNNAVNMQGPGLLAQQQAFFSPSVMNTPEQTRADGAAFLQSIASGPLGMAPMGALDPALFQHYKSKRFQRLSFDEFMDAARQSEVGDTTGAKKRAIERTFKPQAYEGMWFDAVRDALSRGHELRPEVIQKYEAATAAKDATRQMHRAWYVPPRE